MADVNLNALIDGVSGKIGKKLVLRQRGGRTLLASKAQLSGIVSDKQAAQRERFRKATQYARVTLLTPALKAEYEAAVKGDAFMNAFSAAVADYLKVPEIASINLDNYQGKPGDKIIITSAVDYKLVGVKVSIQKADGSVLEAGEATSSGTRLEWTYVTTTPITDLADVKVVITATDRPGNQTTSEESLL
jgi:hypothetical protein